MRPSHRDRAAVAILLLGCGLVSVAVAPAARADGSAAARVTTASRPVGPPTGDAGHGAPDDPLGPGGPLAVHDDPLPLRTVRSAPGPLPVPAPAAARTRVPPAYVLPVRGYHLSARFDDRGSRWGGARHTGLDLVVPSGTPVHVVAAGLVTEAGWAGPYGRSVVVTHADGTRTRYAHLSSVAVSAGQHVAVAAVLGRSGATGNVTGPHLHLEVVVGGRPVDPFAWLTHRGLRP